MGSMDDFFDNQDLLEDARRGFERKAVQDRAKERDMKKLLEEIARLEEERGEFAVEYSASLECVKNARAEEQRVYEGLRRADQMLRAAKAKLENL